MRAVSSSARTTLVLLCLTQYLVKSDRKDSGEPIHRDSDIDRLLPDHTERGHTTRCYEDLPPLSVEVDGAPACAPVVYGSEHDLNSEEKMIKMDEEVKRLRAEFFKKRRTTTPGGPKKVRRDVRNRLIDDINEINGLNNQKNKIDEIPEGNNVVKQAWNVEQLNKQHWNKESNDKLNKKDKAFTLFPEVDSEPGYKHDQLQRDIHEEIYGDPSMKENNKVKIKSKKEMYHKVDKVKGIKNNLKNLLDLGNNLQNEKGFKNYKKMMEIELRETTNQHQYKTVYGPACGSKKISKTNEKNVQKEKKKAIKLKRRKRNIKSTKRPKSKKTTRYFMDVDGRFRDIEEIERERNEFESMEAKQTQPDWIHDDGYRPKTERKFRPRPSLGYNRVPKEPLDYGSYDRSEHWRMMTELIHSGTLAAKFYESLSMPKIPSTKEVVSVCRENFTTSECFRYPDISRLRDTREKKFMKKYYHKEYPEFESTD